MMDDLLKSLFGRVFDGSAEPLAVLSWSDDTVSGEVTYANAAYDRLRDAAAAVADGELFGSTIFDSKGNPRFQINTQACPSDLPAAPTWSTATLATLLDGLACGAVVHRDFHPLLVNRPAANMLGLESCDALAAEPTLLRYLTVESLPVLLADYLQPKTDGPVNATLSFVKPSGERRWVDVGQSAVSIGGENVPVLTLVDADDRYRAHQRETLLRDAVDNLSDSFILYDTDDRVVLTNKRFHEVFPFLAHQDEINGKTMLELVRMNVEKGAVTDPRLQEMDKEAWIESFIQARRTHSLAMSEDTWPDGRWDLVKEQRLDSGGFVSVRTDITDRKHAEFALKDQEAHLEQALAERTKHLSAVLSNVAQGVLVLDPELRVVLTNQGFHELLACPQELGTPGTHVRDLIADRMERGFMFAEELESDAERDALVDQRIESYRPLARERFRHIFVGPRTLEVHREKLSDGTVICTYSDITDRVRAEEEVERQREALHQSEKLSALGMLLAGVAHELNNPLQVVLGNAALLENDSVDEDQAKRAGTIRDAAERCAKIIKTFLAMARDTPASRAPVDLNELVRRSLNLIAYQLRVKDIGVDLDLSPALPQVLGDGDQLSQVIVNLLLNAMHAMEQADSPHLITVRTRRDTEHHVIELRVSDTGPGVPDDIRRRIFDPFFTTKPEGLGTGIGLAVCHGMIAAHNGTIRVDDAPGGGACFVVRLPESGDNTTEPGEATGLTSLTGRVLIVDDEPDIRELLADILETSGLEIELAAGGQEALDLIESRHYDAIVCDLRMPGLDGPGLYDEVARRVPEIRDRFIFATGDLLSQAADDFLARAGRPCLTKPFLPTQVRRIVSAVAKREDDIDSII